LWSTHRGGGNFQVLGTANKFDEFYTYDGLHRLTNMDRGTLTGDPCTGVSENPPEKQEDWRIRGTQYPFI
jgi:hypothetical protein